MKSKRLLAALTSAALGLSALTMGASAVDLFDVVDPDEDESTYWDIYATGYYMPLDWSWNESDPYAITDEGKIELEFEITEEMTDPDYEGKGALGEMGVVIYNLPEGCAIDAEVTKAAFLPYEAEDEIELKSVEGKRQFECNTDLGANPSIFMRPTDRYDEETEELLYEALPELKGMEEEGSFRGGWLRVVIDFVDHSPIDPATVELPFELEAPSNVGARWLEGNDSYNTTDITYSQNNSMSEWSTRKYAEHDTVMEELAEMGYDDLWISPQIDWSIDSTDDWHCNRYWTTGGYDENYAQHLGDWAYLDMSYSAETVNNSWVFRGMGNAADPENATWYGVHDEGIDIPGWADVLKEGQYELIEDEDNEKYAKIDLTEHTIYFRVRYAVTVWTTETARRPSENVVVVSDWSKTAAVGKDAAALEPVKPGEVAAPVISDLKPVEGAEFNNWPVYSFKLDVDDTLNEQLTRTQSLDGLIWLEVFARVKGTTEWVGLQGDWEVKAGNMEVALQNIMESPDLITINTPIELRARYYVSPDGDAIFTTEFCEPIEFLTVIPGDVNGDGKVNMRDYALLQRHILYNTPIVFDAADLNNDGKVNMRDYALLQKMLLKPAK